MLQNKFCCLAFLILTLIAPALLCAATDKPVTRALKKWHIVSSIEVEAGGARLSRPGASLQGWHPATVPGTVLASLEKAGKYDSLYFGKNLLKVEPEQFEQPWWYRTSFQLPEKKNEYHSFLHFKGVNYRADVWLNGRQIAAADTLVGAFRFFEFDVTALLKTGENVLAVKVFPPRPGDFTIGFVDWNPVPPDNNMGLWREVALLTTGPVSLKDPQVITDLDLRSLRKAGITIVTELINHSAKAVSGVLSGDIEAIHFEKKIKLAAFERRTVHFTPDEFPGLLIKKPRLWWPSNLGAANLYQLNLRFSQKGRLSDKKNVTFGIRHVADYVNDAGYRGYKINGKKVLIKGGGWVDDLLLADTYKSIAAQLKYVKQMNLNTVRLEGFWGKDERLYDLCDSLGLMIMVGWSCQWEWEEYAGKPADQFGAIKEPTEMELVARSLRDQVTWLRNHPGIFVWLVGSDKLPRPALERKYVDVLKDVDPTRPYLAAAGGINSEVSGPTRVKMNGPYAFTPPVYWYADTANGGAFGFNTETSPGAQVPPLESIKRMIPPAHLWPIDHYWEYHCGRNNFNTLERFQKALDLRYGKSTDVADFARRAQVMNYELIRPMFEAFAVNKHKRATGIIQWMLNSSWPEMYWQLYDSFLNPTGAFYGTQKACKPLHIIYNYGDKSIYAVNDYLRSFGDLKAEVSVFNINSQKIYTTSHTFSLRSNRSKRILPASDMPLDSIALSTTYFLDLCLLDSERRVVDRNFYWLSRKADIPDYAKTEWYYTPIRQYADMTALNDLPPATVNAAVEFADVGSENVTARVTLSNKSDGIAFFIESRIVGEESGRSVLPIFWNDNYISLLPGEIRRLQVVFKHDDLNGEKPVYRMSGWNVASSSHKTR